MVQELNLNIFSFHLAREKHSDTRGLGGGQEDGEREEGESGDCTSQVGALLSPHIKLPHNTFSHFRAGASLANGMNVHLNSDRK